MYLKHRAFKGFLIFSGEAKLAFAIASASEDGERDYLCEPCSPIVKMQKALNTYSNFGLAILIKQGLTINGECGLIFIYEPKKIL